MKVMDFAKIHEQLFDIGKLAARAQRFQEAADSTSALRCIDAMETSIQRIREEMARMIPGAEKRFT